MAEETLKEINIPPEEKRKIRVNRRNFYITAI